LDSVTAKAVEKLDGRRNWMVAKPAPMSVNGGMTAAATLRWSVEQRLAFIEERLFWLGEVNRGDLIRRFGVSPSQASKDIAHYLHKAPPGLSYDKSVKRYVAGEDYRPVFAAPNASSFLDGLRLAGLGLLSNDAAPPNAAVPFEAAPVPERRIDPYVLRKVLLAIRAGTGLAVTYQSMSREAPVRRRICPHALAHDGFRWHTRAFDAENGDFRDFVLGRISRPRPDRKLSARPADDHDWQNFVELVIAPHPGLTPAQRQAIALDYGITRRSIRLKVRRALLFYALKKLGLDLPENTRPPHQQHIVLVNRAEVLQRPPQQQQA
jgi:hypothetical protein